MSSQDCVACEVIIIILYLSIYYFESIKFPFLWLKLNYVNFLHIEIKFNFYINIIMTFLLKLIFLLNIFNNIKFI